MHIVPGIEGGAGQGLAPEYLLKGSVTVSYELSKAL